jgi:hypothetical protein
VFAAAGVERQLLLETHSAVAVCALVQRGLGVAIVNPLTARACAGADMVVRPLEFAIAFQVHMLLPLHRPTAPEVDWLVLSGSLLAHPRASTLLGWPQVPLRQVAASAGDPLLQRAVAAVGAIGTEGRSNLLLLLPGTRAQPWRELPFQLLACDREAQARWGQHNISRVTIAPPADSPKMVTFSGSPPKAARLARPQFSAAVTSIRP